MEQGTCVRFAFDSSLGNDIGRNRRQKLFNIIDASLCIQDCDLSTISTSNCTVELLFPLVMPFCHVVQYLKHALAALPDAFTCLVITFYWLLQYRKHLNTEMFSILDYTTKQHIQCSEG